MNNIHHGRIIWESYIQTESADHKLQILPIRGFETCMSSNSYIDSIVHNHIEDIDPILFNCCKPNDIFIKIIDRLLEDGDSKKLPNNIDRCIYNQYQRVQSNFLTDKKSAILQYLILLFFQDDIEDCIISYHKTIDKFISIYKTIWYKNIKSIIYCHRKIIDYHWGLIINGKANLVHTIKNNIDRNQPLVYYNNNIMRGFNYGIICNAGIVLISKEELDKGYIKPSAYFQNALDWDIIVVSHGYTMVIKDGVYWGCDPIQFRHNEYTNVQDLVYAITDNMHNKRILILICNDGKHQLYIAPTAYNITINYPLHALISEI